MLEKSAIILVIQSDGYNWTEAFAGLKLKDGREIQVVQAGWDSIYVDAESPAMAGGNGSSILVHVRKRDGIKIITIKPFFVLVRNEVRGIRQSEDKRNALFGLMYAGVPSINSLASIYAFLDRPVVQAELHKIQNRVGEEKFPVIPQSFYSSFENMMYGRKFPVVLKVGHAHAGMGKMRIRDHHEWEDVRSVVSMTEGKYCTAEPFIDGDFDVRIQKIGEKNYRAYKIESVSGNWKKNTGCSTVNEIEVTDVYKMYIDEASKIFGGLCICTVDLIVENKTGKHYILEVNGTSSGLFPDNAEEDNLLIRD